MFVPSCKGGWKGEEQNNHNWFRPTSQRCSPWAENSAILNKSGFLLARKKAAMDISLTSNDVCHTSMAGAQESVKYSHLVINIMMKPMPVSLSSPPIQHFGCPLSLGVPGHFCSVWTQGLLCAWSCGAIGGTQLDWDRSLGKASDVGLENSRGEPRGAGGMQMNQEECDFSYPHCRAHWGSLPAAHQFPAYAGKKGQGKCYSHSL